MSNRRKIKPAPYAVQAFADESECPDCDAYVGEPEVDKYGIWHLVMRHDDGCPWYGGVTR